MDYKVNYKVKFAFCCIKQDICSLEDVFLVPSLTWPILGTSHRHHQDLQPQDQRDPQAKHLHPDLYVKHFTHTLPIRPKIELDIVSQNLNHHRMDAPNKGNMLVMILELMTDRHGLYQMVLLTHKVCKVKVEYIHHHVLYAAVQTIILTVTLCTHQLTTECQWVTLYTMEGKIMHAWSFCILLLHRFKFLYQVFFLIELKSWEM